MDNHEDVLMSRSYVNDNFGNDKLVMTKISIVFSQLSSEIMGRHIENFRGGGF